MKILLSVFIDYLCKISSGIYIYRDPREMLKNYWEDL